MAECTVTRRIDAATPRVFAIFTDFENAAENIDAIEKIEVLTDGPVGVGTRFRETRIMFKREATEDMEITQFDQDRFYRVEAASCGAKYVTEFTFTPDGDGTTVEVTFTATPVAFLAKVMSPLSRMMMGWLVKLFEKDIDSLERALGTKPGADGTAPQPETAG